MNTEDQTAAIYDIEQLQEVAALVQTVMERWRNCGDSAAGLLTRLKGLPLENSAIVPLEELTRQYQDTSNAAVRLRNAATRYAQAEESELESLNTLRNVAARDYRTLDAVLASAPEISDSIKKIFLEQQSLQNTVRDLHAKASALAAEIEEPPPPPVSTMNLHEHVAERKRLEALIETLAKQCETILTEARVRALAKLGELELRFDLEAASPALKQTFQDIRSRVDTGDTVAALRQVQHDCLCLQQQLESAPEAQRISLLADSALASGGKPAAIVSLATALNRRQRHPEALALLSSMQSAWDAAEAEFDDYSSMVMAILEAAACCCDPTKNQMWWPEVVLAQPWIAGFCAADVQNQDVRRKLSLCVMLYAQHHDVDEWQPHFFQFDQAALFMHLPTPTIQRLINDMTGGHATRIADSAHAGRLALTERKLSAFFTYNDQRAEYDKQRTKKSDVHAVEKDILFPKLLAIRDEVHKLCEQRDFEAATRLINRVDGEKLWAESCNARGLDPYRGKGYLKGIYSVDGYIPELKALLKEYVKTVAAMPSEHTIPVEAIREEIRALAANDINDVFWDRLMADLSQVVPPMQVPAPFDNCMSKLCATEQRVMALGVSFLALQSKDPLQSHSLLGDPSFHQAHLKEMLRMMPEGECEARHVDLLREQGCLHHAALVAKHARGHVAAASDLAQHDDTKMHDLRKELSKRKERESVGRSFDEVCSWLDWHCYPAVEKWLEDQKAHELQMTAISEAEKRQKLEALIAQNRRLVEAIEDQVIDSTLQEQMRRVAMAVGERARGMRGKSFDAQSFDGDLCDLGEWVERLQSIVDHQDPLAIEELSHELQLVQDDKKDLHPADLEPIDQPELSLRDQEWIKDAMFNWQKLAEDWPLDELEEYRRRNSLVNRRDPKLDALTNDLRGTVKEFLKPFCGRSRLYVLEGTGKNLNYADVDGTFLEYGVTTMRKPRNRYLERFALLVLPGRRPHRSHLLAVENWIATHPEELKIILVPGEPAYLQRLRADFASTKKAMFLGHSDIKDFLDGPHSESARDRLRQAFVRKNIGAANPYAVDGPAIVQWRLFAGRESELEALATNPGYYLCGGRRIGKTSLMRALEERLRESSSEIKVAYVDCQLFRDVQTKEVGHWDVELLNNRTDERHRPNADPDLAVARSIAKALELPAPDDLAAFHESLKQQLLAGSRAAILIDEMDCYLHASRWYHGDQRVPLMSQLRSLHQEHQGTLKIVLAGFKDLFFECQRTESKDASHPFRNWLPEMRLGVLTYKETGNDLIREGLCKQMGYTLDARACQKINEIASGNPAFIQYFCIKLCQSKLLMDASSHHIGLPDVERVYQDVTEAHGAINKESFLHFIERTLDMNLDPLELAIILTVANKLKDQDRMEVSISRTEVVSLLDSYVDILCQENPDIIRPAPRHLHWAFMNLRMSGLLEKERSSSSGDEHDANYKFAYRSYIDILVRMDRLGHIRHEKNQRSYLEHAIQEYKTISHAVQPSHS